MTASTTPATIPAPVATTCVVVSAACCTDSATLATNFFARAGAFFMRDTAFFAIFVPFDSRAVRRDVDDDDFAFVDFDDFRATDFFDCDEPERFAEAADFFLPALAGRD